VKHPLTSDVCVVLLTRDSFLGCVIFMLFVCSVAWLFLLVQVIDWKDSSPK